MSAGTIYDRWFISPVAEYQEADESGETVTYKAPKYHDTEGIIGYSGVTISPATVSDHYPTLVQVYPDVSEWFIVRMHGEGISGWGAINAIHNYQDTRTLADHADDVAPVLNSHFPRLEWSGEKWADSIKSWVQ
jgi:hypothetical protein